METNNAGGKQSDFPAVRRQQFIYGMNNKDIGKIERLMSPDFVNHDLPPGQKPGPDGMRDMIQMFFDGFPDLKVSINQIAAEDDVVAAAMTTEGTQTREFMGIPASGKKISISGMHMVRVADDKVIEHWGVADAMGMMQQLGVMPGN